MFGTNGLEVPHILTQICTRFPTVDLKILGSCVCGSSKIAKKKKFKKCWTILYHLIQLFKQIISANQFITTLLCV